MALCLASAFAVAAESVGFNKQIRPILADNCYHCHGPDKGTREAGLRLDERDAALAGVQGRPAIVPGNSAASEIIKRVTHADPAQRMPRGGDGKPLTSQQIALLEQWIHEGAKFEPHWSYLAPQRKTPPRAGHPVDAFLRAELDKEHVSMAPQADPRVLIRRLSFDLLGLPPTPAEVDAFIADTAPDAYEKSVDRMLASPRFGERMAVNWLDLVRYANTVGYHGDQDIDVAPYRDYVIRAFNENLRYDRFTREQLAGDLLPDAGLQQKIASAYNRLNMVTREGGAQAKEYLAKYAGDRVRTTSSVWMGATLGCAQCHDHKFDPYTTKDFYSFAAFFADVKEEGVYKSSGFYEPFAPVVKVATPEQAQHIARLDEQLAALDQQIAIARTRAVLPATLASWEQKLQRIRHSDEAAESPLVIDDQAYNGKKMEEWHLVSAPTQTGKRVREQTSEGLIQHFVQDFPKPYKLKLGDRFYAYIHLDSKNPPATVMLQWLTKKESWSHRAYWGQDLIPYGTIGQDSPDHRHVGDLPAPGHWVRLEVEPAKVGLRPGDEIRGIAFTQHAGRVWWDAAGLLVSAKSQIPPAILAILDKPAAARTDADQAALTAHYNEQNVLTELRGTRDAVKREKDVFEKDIPNCVVTESVAPREVRVLPRGNWMDETGEIVQPAVPHFLPQPPATTGRLSRLDLANWFVARENPLTARVFVNRLWKLYFGAGLSKVLDDLGNRGEWPRHLDLLDWLAVEFMESGWDVKHMVRLIVTSAAYRQSSTPSEKLREADPYNRLLARQARPRIEAEFVRDTALAVSGLLVEKTGGLGAKPYQPAGYYKELNFPKREYQADKDANQYRRGVYTHWQRTYLHPSLLAFDAPPREECTAERNISNTPLQALTLLNDPTYVEAARVFAQHIIEQGGDGFPARLGWAYRQALSRLPTDAESATLKALLDNQLAVFKTDPDSAKQLVAVGFATVPEKFDVAELAAWTSVGRAILNLHETIVRY